MFKPDGGHNLLPGKESHMCKPIVVTILYLERKVIRISQMVVTICYLGRKVICVDQ